MGKINRDYSGVDHSKNFTEYAGETPKPGIYDGRLDKINDHPTDNSPDGLEWIFQITEEPYEGWAGWLYTNGDSSAWKEQQVMEAIGAINPGDDGYKGTTEALVKNAAPVRLKVTNETYEGEKRAKIKTVLQMPGASKGSGKKKGKGKKGKDESPF